MTGWFFFNLINDRFENLWIDLEQASRLLLSQHEETGINNTRSCDHEQSMDHYLFVGATNSRSGIDIIQAKEEGYRQY